MKYLLIIGISIFLFPSCAFKKVPNDSVSDMSAESPKASKIEPKARNQFFLAERQFFNKDYDKAIGNYQQVKKKFPRSKASQLASYRVGSIYYYQENYANASREFEAYLSQYPQTDLTLDVTYNLAAAEYQLAHYEKAYQFLNRLKPAEIQAQGPRRAEIIYQLKAQVAESMNQPALAIGAYAAKAQLPLAETERARIEEEVDRNLTRIVNINDLEKLRNEVSEPVTKGKISQRLAMLSAPPPPMQVEPQEYEAPATISGGSSGNRMSVGVVLPLSGRFAAYGKKALDGILLGAKIFQGNRDREFELHIKDTRSSPAVAAAAVDQLYSDNRVMAILGPLSFREALSVADRAQTLGVVNISLTSKDGISEKNPYLFQNALTPQIQLESLIQYCVGQKGLKRFAILAPNNSFGKDMTNEFWGLVEAAGGKITAYNFYSPDEKDFQDQVQEMVGLNPKYRRFEVAKLAEYAKEQKTKTGREPKTKLSPIIDFDAIFIPDGPKMVGSIAASLAFFDVNVPLLGTTEWNNDQLYKRGGKHVVGSIFPGGLSSANTGQKEFIKNYVDAYGGTPDLLALQSYEAMELIHASLTQSKSSSRGDLANTLSQLRNFTSPLGQMSFDNNRIAKRKIPIYTLEQNGNISQIQ